MMKRSILALSLMLLMGLMVCNQTLAQSFTDKNEIDYSAWISCANDGAGEWVTGTLVMHNLYHLNKDGIVTKFQSHPSATDFVGMDTGMKYEGNGVTQNMFDSNPLGNGAITYTFINRYHFVGQGIQFYIKETSHYTINANGEMTADFYKYDTVCE